MATPIKVLIVEDSEDDAAVLLRELRNGGFDVTYDVVDTHEEMSACLANEVWDIVISDYDMPRFSSSAALKLVGETEYILPFIIILSGVIGEEAAVAAMQEGAQDYIFKGNMRRLVPAIQRELLEADRRREHKQLENVAEQLVKTQERVVRSEGLRRQELETLFNIASILVEPGLFQPKYQEVLDKLLGISQANLATLRVLDEKGQSLNLLAQSGPESLTRSSSLSLDSVSGRALKLGKTVVVNDYLSQPNLDPSEVEQGTRSLVSLPIKVGAGKALGVVNVVSHEADHFAPDLINVLTAIVGGLGVLLDQAKLMNEFEASMEAMALVDEVAGKITSVLDIDSVYEEFILGTKNLIKFDRMYIILVDQQSGAYSVKLLFGPPRRGRNSDESAIAYTDQMQEVIATGHPLIREDFESGQRSIQDQIHFKLGLRSSITVELSNRGRQIGTLELLSSQSGAYGYQEQAILVRLARHLATAVENARLFAEAKSGNAQAA